MAMYKKILIPLENGPADEAILNHIKPLAKMMGSSLLLMHVADGWAARNFERLNLAESEEMKADRYYLEKVSEGLRAEGFEVGNVLALGEPSEQIIKFTKSHHIDLIAMSTHGHRLVGDIIYGSTADKVRHVVTVPVLMLKAKK
jgi:nucleotide-binding universal stress UspA family protein